MDDMTGTAADGPHAAAGILGTWERTADGILLLDAGAAAAVLGEGGGSGASMPAAEYASHLRLRDRARLANALFHAAPGRFHRVAYAVVVDGVERRIVERGRFRAAAGGGVSGAGVLMEADEDDWSGTDGDPILEGVAADCLNIRRRLEAHGGADHLKAMFDVVLIEIGRELARSARA
ncbi:hypothetical protein [Methylobacterium radiotolerans]|uniref:hypothetical protein n=1 Tax=Methylobacterium radiotolerans TaxID=31998 RepID=UPI0038D03FB6